MNMKSISRAVMLVLLVFFAINGLVVMNEYVGYVSFEGEGGNIYEILIKHHIPVDQWVGIYGVAVRFDGAVPQSQVFQGGQIESENLLFECLEPDRKHEIYASTFSDFDLSSASPATTGEVDSFYGLNVSSIDSASNTYTSNITFDLGTFSIAAPGTYSYQLGEEGNPSTWATAAIKDAQGRIGFAILASDNLTIGFNGEAINYQGLLPVFPGQASTTYYFFTDPNDLCPAGEGEEPPKSFLIGNVTDQGGNVLSDVIVEVAGYATLSDGAGFYNLSTEIGTHRIFAIKEGFNTYVNNVTVVENSTTIHSIVMVEDVNNPNTGIGPGQDAPGDQTETGVGPGQDVGPGQSDGEDIGPGQAPPVPFVEQPKEIEGTDYIISMSEIKRKIRIDNFHQESLYIFSFKDSSVEVDIALLGDNLSSILTLDKTQFIVAPDSNEHVIITIWGKPPEGTYEGNLTISGEINATIPILIEVLPRDQLSVEALMMNLETNQKEVLPGERFKFKTDLRNLLVDQQYPVNLLFTIQPLEGNETVWSFQTNVYLKTAFSLIRTVELPQDLAAGDYVLRVSARYLGLASSTDTIFSLAVPFWHRTLFGMKNWVWGIILFVILAAAAAGYLLYRNIQSKKKYHLKVEYSELPQPGPRNVFVGKIAETEHKTYFNLENFKVHTIVAGSTGGGKSVSAQIIVEEALEKDVAVICFDPTAQWSGMLRKCTDKTMLSLYPLFGMKKADAKAYNGNIRMITNPRERIDIQKYAKPGEIQVFACHKLDPKDMDVVVANAIREIFHANFPESKPLKILFVFDEVHRLLPKFGGSGDGFLQIERACREFRKWGLGVVLVSQVLSDFMGTIKANINTEVQMRTRDEGDLERVRQKYGEDVLRSLVKATVGSGMVENPAYNRGKPYFVAFRPLKHSVERLGDEEIEQYNKYNDMVDELYFWLDQLEAEGVDVFDLKLELKLALDKVKQGNFNMVQIYIDGLKPRIEKQFEKIGKSPKKFERELVDESELKEELAKAQQERENYEKENAHDAQEKEEEKKWEWSMDAPPDKLLNLQNGMVVLSLASLYDEISAMKEDDWDSEVNERQNTLADWVENATGLKNLADTLRTTLDQGETKKILEKFKAGEEFDPVDPSKFKSGRPEEVGAESGEGGKQEGVSSQQEVKDSVVSGKSDEGTDDSKSVSEQAAERDEAGEASDSVNAEGDSQPHEQMPVRTDGEEESGAETDDSVSLERLVTDNPEEFFRLENGKELRSAKELADYLPNMDDDVFRKHVGENYNHFADWVRGVFHEDELANKLAEAHSKEDMMVVMQ